MSSPPRWKLNIWTTSKENTSDRRFGPEGVIGMDRMIKKSANRMCRWWSKGPAWSCCRCRTTRPCCCPQRGWWWGRCRCRSPLGGPRTRPRDPRRLRPRSESPWGTQGPHSCNSRWVGRTPAGRLCGTGCYRYMRRRRCSGIRPPILRRSPPRERSVQMRASSPRAAERAGGCPPHAEAHNTMVEGATHARGNPRLACSVSSRRASMEAR